MDEFLPPLDPADYDGMTTEELLAGIGWATALLDSIYRRGGP